MKVSQNHGAAAAARQFPTPDEQRWTATDAIDNRAARTGMAPSRGQRLQAILVSPSRVLCIPGTIAQSRLNEKPSGGPHKGVAFVSATARE
ncbi:hypothetical protein MRX96_012927 [Rhipicephalus microplus]